MRLDNDNEIMGTYWLKAGETQAKANENKRFNLFQTGIQR